MALDKRWLILAVVVLVVTGLLWRQYTLNSSLLEALRHSDVPKAQALLQQGASANAKDQSGSALQDACTRGALSTVQLLLRRGASLSPEHAAHILDSMAEVQDDQVAANREDYWHIIALLLAHGAKINQRGNLGHTPLTLAVWQCNIEISRLFLASDADVNVQLTNGLTALGHAAYNNVDWKAKQMIFVLRSYGAKLSATELRHKENYAPYAYQ